MKPKEQIQGLYAIADGGCNPCGSFDELVRKFLDGGCRLVQLRMKGSSKGEHLAAARAIAELKNTYPFTFIINDHPDIALEVGADGVHVGSNDAAVSAIRREFGDSLIVGYSAHSMDEAVLAAQSADYVAFGAIFPTKNKGPDHPVQGLEMLRQVVDAVDVPVVAIGGIGRGNIDSVIDTGVTSIAMISALCESGDIRAETQYFIKKYFEQ